VTATRQSTALETRRVECTSVRSGWTVWYAPCDHEVGSVPWCCHHTRRLALPRWLSGVEAVGRRARQRGGLLNSVMSTGFCGLRVSGGVRSFGRLALQRGAGLGFRGGARARVDVKRGTSWADRVGVRGVTIRSGLGRLGCRVG
jgi:hypothetical protein